MCAMEQDHFFSTLRCACLPFFFRSIKKPVRQPVLAAKSLFLNLRFAQLIVKRRILRCFCHFLLLVTRALKLREGEKEGIRRLQVKRRRVHVISSSPAQLSL